MPCKYISNIFKNREINIENQTMIFILKFLPLT